MGKNKDMHSFMEDLKMKRKKDKKILTCRSENLNPRFSVIFPPMIWIFMWSEEPEIKSKQASKRDRTLQFRFSKKATKIWKNVSIDLMLTKLIGRFRQMLVAFLENLNFMKKPNLQPNKLCFCVLHYMTQFYVKI